MIRILVVEDEQVIRDGLIKHVPWQELGIGEVRSAANAEAALELCKEYTPDIISSDIRMPGMSGVELCARIRESFPDITILFVTGYSDKEYLKAAINLHAVRYVEKPIQMAEYADAVEEAVRQVQRIRERKASQFRTITFGTEGDIEAISLTAKYNRVGLLHLERAELLPVVREKLAEQLRPLQKEFGFHFLAEQRDSDNLMFMIGRQSTYSESEIECMLQRVGRCVEVCAGTESRWFLSYGSLAYDAEQIRRSWEQAYYGLGTLAYLGWNRTVMPADWKPEGHDTAIPEELTEQFQNAVIAEELPKQRECLERLYRFLCEKEVFMRADIRFLYLSWNRMLLRARRQRDLKRRANEALQENLQLFEKAQTFQEIHEYLLTLLEDATAEETAKEDNAGSSSFLIQKVTEYIARHYGDRDLSIRILADQVGLTPTYLSNLFKKDTGITIGQYLMDVRMGHAKRLMRDPQKKIYEIADQVGYEDVDYFARVFKRVTGMTPSEYRRKQL